MVQSSILRNPQIWLVEALLIMQLRYEYDAVIMTGTFDKPKVHAGRFFVHCLHKVKCVDGRQPLAEIQHGGSKTHFLTYSQKSPLFFSATSFFWIIKNGWLWRRCWLGWSSCTLKVVPVYYVVLCGISFFTVVKLGWADSLFVCFS